MRNGIKMKKNLEYIIFACIFYDFDLFQKIEQNIFIDLYYYYACLFDIHAKGYVVTKDFFIKYLEERKIYIYKLDDILLELEDEDSNFDYYLSEWLKVYNSKKILEVINNNKDLNNNELLLKIQNTLIEKKDHVKVRTMFDIMIDKQFEDIIPTVKIGRIFFDKFENGFRNSEMILIAARTSIGKSSEMKQLVLKSLLNNYKIGMFSAEMSEKRIVKDMLALIAEVSKRDYVAGKLDEQKKMYIAKAKDEIKDYAKRLWIEDKENIEINALCKIAEKMKQWGANIIFVDYIQLVSTYGLERKERRLQVDYISKKLKGLAKKLDIPIVALAQIHRLQDGKKHPTKSDLKDCGSLEEDADIVIILSVEKWLDLEKFTKCIVRNNVDKNRNGATGMYFTEFDRVTGNIQDINYKAEEF